ncbi:MAG: polysaccharide biosynthesis tyrosine autokinase [Phycisphaera sp.]|nr:polysaccharide biosynthesis tyrosine autokinase [Phycisphaera sp.]
MGDVFDALRRAQRDKKPTKPTVDPIGAEASAPGEPAQNESPALPLDDMKHAAQQPEDRTPALALDSVAPETSTLHDERQNKLTGSVVTDAAARSDRHTLEKLDNLPAVRKGEFDPSLNGYADEIIVHHDRGSAITEQYRTIRTQILARARTRKLQTHVITSSAPAEGKSVSCINLGIAFSELRNQKVLLVEGDLRKPSFAKLFARKTDKGLISLLKGEIDDIEQACYKTVYDNLQFMPAGGRDIVSSTELLSSPRMVQLLERLKDRYDHIFIDTPPVVSVTDAAILGAMSDQVMLVVRLNKTPVEVVDRAKRLLRAANCEVAGVILTHMTYHVPRYLYRYA